MHCCDNNDNNSNKGCPWKGKDKMFTNQEGEKPKKHPDVYYFIPKLYRTITDDISNVLFKLNNNARKTKSFLLHTDMCVFLLLLKQSNNDKKE